jgi:hypothetical protein
MDPLLIIAGVALAVFLLGCALIVLLGSRGRWR